MRDGRAPLAYWDKWIAFEEGALSGAAIRHLANNEEPRGRFELIFRYSELMLRRYSRGDETSHLTQYFPTILNT